MQTTSGNSIIGTEYEEYRTAVINYMKNYLLQIKEDLHSIEPILGRVFEKSKLYGSKNDKVPNINPVLRLKYLQENSSILEILELGLALIILFCKFGTSFIKSPKF